MPESALERPQVRQDVKFESEVMENKGGNHLEKECKMRWRMKNERMEKDKS